MYISIKEVGGGAASRQSWVRCLNPTNLVDRGLTLHRRCASGTATSGAHRRRAGPVLACVILHGGAEIEVKQAYLMRKIAIIPIPQGASPSLVSPPHPTPLFLLLHAPG